MRRHVFCFIIIALFATSGCQSSAPTPPAVAPPVPLARIAAELADQRIDDLLDFETPTDAVFVTASDGAAIESNEQAHSGHTSLRLSPGTTELRIKLGSLLAGRTLPGDWELVGAYFYCQSAVTVSASCDVLPGIEAREVNLPAGRWTALFLELPRAGPTSGAVNDSGSLVFRVSGADADALYCDDVLLAENRHEYYAADTGPRGLPNWTIERRGLHVDVTAPGSFEVRLTTVAAQADGWVVVESGPLRARFESNGPIRELTVYADGRAYYDGSLHWLKPVPSESADDATTPEPAATISIPEDQGRVDRSSRGDTDNSGYNRLTGSYRLIARSATLELTITPRQSAVDSPVIEIANYPAAGALVSVEGRLIDSVDRLHDGTMLIDLPMRMTRPTLVEIRAKATAATAGG